MIAEIWSSVGAVALVALVALVMLVYRGREQPPAGSFEIEPGAVVLISGRRWLLTSWTRTSSGSEVSDTLTINLIEIEEIP